MLQKELKAMMNGERRGGGQNGLIAVEEFEQMLLGIPFEESKVINPDKHRQEEELKQSKLKQQKPKTNAVNFVQNDKRANNLNPAERHLINLQAQEYDQLKIMHEYQRLYKNNPKAMEKDEVYQFKLKQYQDISTLRNESMKVINEQNMKRAKHSFHNYNMNQAVEAQKKDFQSILERMDIARQMQQIAEAQPEAAQASFSQKSGHTGHHHGHDHQLQFKHGKDHVEGKDAHSHHHHSGENVDYDQVTSHGGRYQPGSSNNVKSGGSARAGDAITHSSILSSSQATEQSNQEHLDYTQKTGFEIFFDYCTHLYSNYDKARIVFVIQSVTTQLVEPIMIQGGIQTPDPTDPRMKYIPLNKSNMICGIKAHPSTNLVIEVQVPKPAEAYEEVQYVAYGFTIINLFDFKRDINSGVYMLPLYQCPTLVQLDYRDISKLDLIQHTVLCLRLANGNHDLDQDIKMHKHEDGQKPSEYKIPDIHNVLHESEEEVVFSEEESEVQEEVLDTKVKKEEEEVKGEEAQEGASYEGHGIQLKVHNLMNYKPRAHASVTCTIYQGLDIISTHELVDCQFVTTKRDYKSVKKVMGYTKNERNIGEYMLINEEVLWDQNFYNVYQMGHDIKDINLVIEVHEHTIDGIDMEDDNESDQSDRDYNLTFDKQETQNKEKLMHYAIMKITNTDGTIRYGTFELNMFKPPMNMQKRYVKDQVHHKTVKITLQIPENPDEDKMERVEKKEDKVMPYIEGFSKKADIRDFYKQEAIDFYIDEARYLPDGCLINRLVIKVITNKGNKVMEEVTEFADINESNRYLQDYDFRKEISVDTIAVKSEGIKANTYVEIIIESLDRNDFKIKTVGYAYFPLFLLPDGSGIPPPEEKQAKFIQNKGDFQVPIYYKRAPKKFTWQNILDLPKIQCATMLVRSLSGYKEDDFIDPAGYYSEGFYQNSNCQTTSDELTLYKYKDRRYNPISNITLAYALKQLGVDQRDKAMSYEKVIQVLDTIFGETTGKKQSLKRMYTNIFEPKYGFRLQIQRLHGLNQAPSKDLVHFVVTQFIPPGRLLNKPEMGIDVHVFKDQDWAESTWNSIQFTEQVNYKDIPAQEHLGILFEVKGYDPHQSDDKQIIFHSIGWAYLPLFTSVANENKSYNLYTNSGLFQVPIYQGQVNKKKLVQALDSDNPVAALNNDKDLEHAEPTSLVIRIHDNQLMAMEQCRDYDDLDKTMIPKSGQELYRFDYVEQQTFNKQQNLSQSIKLSRKEHLSFIKRCIKEEYGFNYPKIL